ncbi:MAG: outer membrane protein assembly factor BamB [Pseudomonadota bacterium]
MSPRLAVRTLRRLMPLLVAVGLAGCSIFGDDDEVSEPPTPLAEFTPEVKLKRVVSTKVGGDGEFLRFALRPAGDGTRVFVAGANGTVEAFEANNHKRAWQRKLKAQLTAGPGVGDGRLVVAERNGVLIAMDVATGETLWERDIKAEVLAPPVLGAERVFVRTVDGRLIALDGKSGEQLWFVEQPVPALSQRGIGAPVIVGDVVVAGFDNGRIVAARVISGEIDWEIPLGIPTGRSDIERMVDADGMIAVAGKDLYITGFRARTAAVAAESGQALWARELSSYAGLGVDWANVYLSTDESQLQALGRSNGALEWSSDAFLRRRITAPAVLGEYVVVGDFEGYIHLINARTGELAGRERVDKSAIVMQPYVSNSTLYVQSEKGVVAGYRLQSDASR